MHPAHVAPRCIAVVAQRPCLSATPFAWGCRMTEDGLCSLRLRTPCEWEGAVYDAVTALAPIPVLSGQCLQLPATLALALVACTGPVIACKYWRRTSAHSSPCSPPSMPCAVLDANETAEAAALVEEISAGDAELNAEQAAQAEQLAAEQSNPQRRRRSILQELLTGGSAAAVDTLAVGGKSAAADVSAEAGTAARLALDPLTLAAPGKRGRAGSWW